MLQITIQIAESFNEETYEFLTEEVFELELEHSLVSLSKWESKWEIPFLSEEEHTREQAFDYIKMMIVSGDPPEEILGKLSEENFKAIHTYINAKMSAATFNDRKKSSSQEKITAELIYYWMIALGVPFECQYWHLNRLLNLIKVCNLKNAPKDKMSKDDIAAQQRALNEQRRREYNTRG